MNIQLKETHSSSPDVVVVGGGPIGLWTAIQVKACNPDKEILVLEKYSEYKRAGINLKIQAASLKGLPKVDSLESLKELTTQWGNRSVAIKTIEDELTKCANDLGITILRGQAADPKTIHQQFPKTKIFIGADGAKSGVRKEIFGDQYRFNTPLQYVVQVQYRMRMKCEMSQDDNCVRKVKRAVNTYIREKFAGYFITQIVRPLENGEYQVILRIFVKEETYRKMADATFGNPYYFEEKLRDIPAELKETLIKWWGSQADQEVVSEVEKTNKLTVIPLASYASKDAFKVTRNDEDEVQVTALVGDALQGFPFYRAINNGFLNGTKLAQSVTKTLDVIEDQEDHDISEKQLTAPFISYSRYSTMRGYIEYTRSLFKNMFIVLSNLWLKTSQQVPWQKVRWSHEKETQFYKRGSAIWNELSKED